MLSTEPVSGSLYDNENHVVLQYLAIQSLLHYLIMRTRTTLASFAAVAIALTPVVASAQGLEQTLALVSRLLNGLIGLFVVLAILAFFWGLVRYLWSAGSDDAHKGLQLMFWGVIAIFVMVSIWGIILLLQRTLGVTENQPLIPGGIQFNPLRGGGSSGGGGPGTVQQQSGPF